MRGECNCACECECEVVQGLQSLHNQNQQCSVDLYSKENLEIYVDGKVLHLSNYKNFKGYGWSKFTRSRLLFQNKGQKACVDAFVDAVKKQTVSPIPFDEIHEVADVCISLAHEKS